MVLGERGDTEEKTGRQEEERGEKLKRLSGKGRTSGEEEVWVWWQEVARGGRGRRSVMPKHPKEEAGPSSQKAPRVS